MTTLRVKVSVRGNIYGAIQMSFNLVFKQRKVEQDGLFLASYFPALLITQFCDKICFQDFSTIEYISGKWQYRVRIM